MVKWPFNLQRKRSISYIFNRITLPEEKSGCIDAEGNSDLETIIALFRCQISLCMTDQSWFDSFLNKITHFPTSLWDVKCFFMPVLTNVTAFISTAGAAWKEAGHGLCWPLRKKPRKLYMVQFWSQRLLTQTGPNQLPCLCCTYLGNLDNFILSPITLCRLELLVQAVALGPWGQLRLNPWSDLGFGHQPESRHQLNWF